MTPRKPSPCAPAVATRECETCVRFTSSLRQMNHRRKIIVIDASTVRHGADRCPMWKPE